MEHCNMKWSRDDDEPVDAGIVLRFPSGFQVVLNMEEPQEERDEEPETSSPTMQPGARGHWPVIEATTPSPGLDNLRARALVAWNMVGLSLFASKRLAQLNDVAAEAECVMLALQIELHGGNLTHIAKDLNTSRRSLRERLKRGGLYDWSRVSGRDDEDGVGSTDDNHEKRAEGHDRAKVNGSGWGSAHADGPSHDQAGASALEADEGERNPSGARAAEGGALADVG